MYYIWIRSFRAPILLFFLIGGLSAAFVLWVAPWPPLSLLIQTLVSIGFVCLLTGLANLFVNVRIGGPFVVAAGSEDEEPVRIAE